MPERQVIVRLAAAGVEPVQVAGVFDQFNRRERVKRSIIVMVVAIGLAAMLIPIPIVHLLGIPLLLVVGVILAIRQLSLIGRLRPVRITCPKCGVSNRVGGGLGVSSIAARERTCDSCRRILTVTIEPVDA